jgi:hypothetical protein
MKLLNEYFIISLFLQLYYIYTTSHMNFYDWTISGILEEYKF